MLLSTVKDVFSEGFLSVLEDDSLSKSLYLFKENKLSALAVFNKKGKHTGILALRWIIRSRLDPSTTKIKTLMRIAPNVALNDSLCKTARLMIESEIRTLPVYSGKKLLGFVAEIDVIHGAVKEKFGNTLVEDIMTKNLFVVEEKESVGFTYSLFRNQDISHAPVVSTGKLVGIVSIHDIITHIFQPGQRITRGEIIGEKVRSLNIPVKSIMTKSVINVLPRNTLKDAVNTMIENNISSLVVTSKERPIGIITKRDFIESIAQLERVEPKLTLQFSIKNLKIDESDKNLMIENFKSFSRRYQDTLEAGTLYIYMKSHGTNYAGDQLVHCRLQLRTRKGVYFSSNEGWNAKNTFYRALDKLDKQILRSKEFEHNPKFVRTYLQRSGFPDTEL